MAWCTWCSSCRGLHPHLSWPPSRHRRGRAGSGASSTGAEAGGLADARIIFPNARSPSPMPTVRRIVEVTLRLDAPVFLEAILAVLATIAQAFTVTRVPGARDRWHSQCRHWLVLGVAVILAAPALAAQTSTPGPGPGDRLPVLQTSQVRYHPKGLEDRDGFVLLQFIVDTGGRVDSASIQVVRATDGRFIAAARLMALAARYTPGIERGAPARIMIQQPYRFTGGEVRCAYVVTATGHPQCADSTTAREGP